MKVPILSQYLLRFPKIQRNGPKRGWYRIESFEKERKKRGKNPRTTLSFYVSDESTIAPPSILIGAFHHIWRWLASISATFERIRPTSYPRYLNEANLHPYATRVSKYTGRDAYNKTDFPPPPRTKMDALCRSPRLHDNDSSTVPSSTQRDDPHRSARFHSAAFLEDGDDVRLESRNSPIDPSFQRFLPIFPSMSRVARVVLLPSTRGKIFFLPNGRIRWK